MSSCEIRRLQIGPRMSQAVIYQGTVYLAGQVGEGSCSVAEQTRQALAAVDELLKEAGTSRDRILKAEVWLADMADFDEMNSVWDAWVIPGHTPARACGESKLAEPDLKVEVIVVAAL